MRRVLGFVSVLLSLTAFATGEKVLLTPTTSPILNTLCVSMNCVTEGPHDVTIATKEVKGAIQFTVSSSSGQVKLVTMASLTESGQVSSTDLVHATTRIVEAIEGPSADDEALKAPKQKPTPVKTGRKTVKHPLNKLLAHR